MKSKLALVLSSATLAITSASLPAVAQNSAAQEILNAHNRYRAEVGVPPLIWSNTLANQAQQWANHLASIGGKLQHSSNSERPNEGENLWMGTSHRFSFTQMVENWGNEKRYFIRGTFPKVSSTGNWADVGHYTLPKSHFDAADVNIDFQSRAVGMDKKVRVMPGGCRGRRWRTLGNGCRDSGNDFGAASRPGPAMAAGMPIII